MPRCPACGATKSSGDFPRNRSTKSGLATYCKPCHNEIIKRNSDKRYGSRRNFLIRLRYRISEKDVQDLVDDQGGLCAICRRATPQHVDHDHRTGRVRGILCFNCNRGIAYFDERPADLFEAVDYILNYDPDAPDLADLMIS